MTPDFKSHTSPNDTHLSFLLIEIVNDHSDEEVEGEEGPKYDEDDKVKVHVEVDFSDGLLLHLNNTILPSQTLAVDFEPVHVQRRTYPS